jgi:hypothetical protein
VLKIIVAGPVKSGKTHLLLIIEKALREVGVKNLVVRDEEEAEEWISRGVREFGLDWRVGHTIRFRVPAGHYGSCVWRWSRA